MDDYRQFERRAGPLVAEALQGARVVAVCGARQVGKSTLVRTFESSERLYATLDDLSVLTQAQFDPVGFARSFAENAIVDEVQRVPELLRAIKTIVDRDPRKGRFLLTGSADILALPRLSESLAGRMVTIDLHPLSQSEIDAVDGNVVDALFARDVRWPRAFATRAGLEERVVRGGYPEAVRMDERARQRWFASYFFAMIQRDIRELARITDTVAMGRLLRLVAAWSSHILNFTRLASESEIPKSTLLRYLSLLEQTFLVHQVPAWAGDPGRRLGKAPKLFLNDTGLAAHVLGIDAQTLRERPELFGPLLETFVVNELRAHASWSHARPSLYHYRSHDGLEVDAVLEDRAHQRVAVEVKAASSIAKGDVSALQILVEDRRLHIRRGVIFYRGDRALQLGERIVALPVSLFWTALEGLQ